MTKVTKRVSTIHAFFHSSLNRYVLLIQDGAHANSPALTGKKTCTASYKRGSDLLDVLKSQTVAGLLSLSQEAQLPKSPCCSSHCILLLRFGSPYHIVCVRTSPSGPVKQR